MTVLDINASMLEVGKRREIERYRGLIFKGVRFLEVLIRPERLGINWVLGDAEKLPFADNSFDVYSIAFGIRNCTHVQTVLDEAYRVLAPGGRFMCLEFSHVQNPILERY